MGPCRPRDDCIPLSMARLEHCPLYVLAGADIVYLRYLHLFAWMVSPSQYFSVTQVSLWNQNSRQCRRGSNISNPMVHRGVSLPPLIFLMIRLLTQILVVIMLRTQHVPFFQSSPSRTLGSALGLMSVIGLALPYIRPIASALQMQRSSLDFYGFLVIILLGYILLVQVIKVVYKRLYNEWL